MSKVAFDGIVLAGGASRRFGGEDKALVEFGGRTLLSRALEALSDAHSVVVVGPRRAGYSPDVWAEEKPPTGGPAAALAAGLLCGRSDLVVVLAVDMPLVTSAHVAALLERLCSGEADGVALGLEMQHPQYLAAAYRRNPLESQFSPTISQRGARLHDLISRVSLDVLVTQAAQDCDTPNEIVRLETDLQGILSREPGL